MPATIPQRQYRTGEASEQPRRRRWTTDEYYRAAELGLFRPDERLELIEGEIVEKVSPQGKPHATSIALVSKVVADAFTAVDAHVRVQSPLTLPGDSEPEPDVLAVRGGPRTYIAGHPGPADVLLLVEVSDTTVAFDRTRKAALFARAGVPEYWIVNLEERRLEIFRDPQEGVYRSVAVYGDAETVSPLAAPDAAFSVADLLP